MALEVLESAGIWGNEMRGGSSTLLALGSAFCRSALIAAAVAIASMASTGAVAQSNNPWGQVLGNFLRGAINNAAASSVRKSWLRVDPEIQACLITAEHLEPAALAQQGIGPGDARLQGAMEFCAERVASMRAQMSPDIQERYAAYAQQLADQQAAEMHAEGAQAGAELFGQTLQNGVQAYQQDQARHQYEQQQAQVRALQQEREAELEREAQIRQAEAAAAQKQQERNQMQQQLAALQAYEAQQGTKEKQPISAATTPVVGPNGEQSSNTPAGTPNANSGTYAFRPATNGNVAVYQNGRLVSSETTPGLARQLYGYSPPSSGTLIPSVPAPYTFVENYSGTQVLTVGVYQNGKLVANEAPDNATTNFGYRHGASTYQTASGASATNLMTKSEVLSFPATTGGLATTTVPFSPAPSATGAHVNSVVASTQNSPPAEAPAQAQLAPSPRWSTAANAGSATYTVPGQNITFSIPEDGQVFRVVGDTGDAVYARVGNQLYALGFANDVQTMTGAQAKQYVANNIPASQQGQVGTIDANATYVINASGLPEKVDYRDQRAIGQQNFQQQTGIAWGDLPEYNLGDVQSAFSHLGGSSQLQNVSDPKFFTTITPPNAAPQQNYVQSVSPNNPQGARVTTTAGQVVTDSPPIGQSLAKTGGTPGQIQQAINQASQATYTTPNGAVVTTSGQVVSTAPAPLPPSTTPGAATTTILPHVESPSSTSEAPGLSSADLAWANKLPVDYRSQVLSLSAPQVSAMKANGTWQQYQLNISHAGEAEYAAQGKTDLLSDTTAGLPSAANGLYGPPLTKGIQLAYNVSGAADVVSGAQSGNLLKFAVGAFAFTPVGKAEEVATTAARFVSGVRLLDKSGKVLMEGTADLGPTLDRIASGKLLSYGNDGSVFENRLSTLPQKPLGYYHEYVQPTPGLSDGDGPERIVAGESGEVYYTPDHYQTFVQLN